MPFLTRASLVYLKVSLEDVSRGHFYLPGMTCKLPEDIEKLYFKLS